MTNVPWWASENVWRKTAIWVTAFMLLVLIVLTFDSIARIAPGHSAVQSYSVINQRVYYVYGSERGKEFPVIGEAAPLFGEMLTEEEAEALVTKGKLTVQSRNCMNCHTLLGNGAYFAPDLTKAWLDQGWGAEAIREQLMLTFLLDPGTNARTYGSNRRMPDLGLTEEEARGVIAFLKWMSAIDTNGFPRGFKPIAQEGDS